MNENKFEKIKRIDKKGKEFWSSRELAKVLEYSDYRKFINVIKKAKTSCKNSGEVIHNHFVHMDEMVQIGSGAEREMETIFLSRYACYLIIQNSDSTKVVVALGQTYFAIQTRRQEISENLIEDNKRIMLRGELSEHNKNLKITYREVDGDRWTHMFTLTNDDNIKYKVEFSGEAFKKLNESEERLISFLKEKKLKENEINVFLFNNI